MGQKKVLAVQDLAGLGRSSLVPVIGVLCAMGHQCVPVPTAIYSSHLALPGWHGCDSTAGMRPALAQYAALGLRFDAVLTGFFSAAEQADIVAEAAERFGGLLVVDPVLGDNGRLYRSASPELCLRVKELCRRADVITPNAAEAAVLLGLGPKESPRGAAEAGEWAARLWREYGASAVVTGLTLPAEGITDACCENGKVSLITRPRLAADYPGTGDIFAAVLTGALLQGLPLTEAAAGAADFVRACIEAAAQQGGDPLLGVAFERELYRLVPPGPPVKTGAGT